MNRRSFLKSSGIILGAGSGCVAGYAAFVEAWWLEVNRTQLRLNSSSSKTPLKILHLSDFHFSGETTLSIARKSLQLGAAAHPDLICLTGDFICQTIPDYQRSLDFLRRFNDIAPTFAVLGNHDGGSWVDLIGGYKTTDDIKALLKEAKIQCLYNENTSLRVRGQDLHLVGVGDDWANELDAERAFHGIPNDAKNTILLCHNPDAKRLVKDCPWQLMLAGHTHGGQIVVPITGHAPFAPVWDKRYLQGLKPWDSRWINVTKGVGSTYGIRFGCRPEVSILELFV
jgi:hypothetical protein